MKKTLIFAVLTVLFAAISLRTNAQIGSTCDTPHVILSLPFVTTGLNTSTSGNAYASLPCSGTFPNYMSGNDYVFSYTPLYSHNAKIILSNTGMTAAVFVTNACPDTATGCVAQGTSIQGNPVINTVGFTAGTTYFIIVSSVSQFAQTTAFDIEVTELYAYDAAVTQITSPVSDCGLTSTEEVKIIVKNLGTQAINDFQLGYILNGVPSTPVTITTPLPAGDSLLYTFQPAIDLSATGVYLIDAYVFISNDENTSNDTISVNVANQQYINTLPYTEDFESGNGGWSSGGTNNSWELGTPTATVINTPAPGGQNSWVTNLDGNHNLQENSYVLGPCFDFSNYQNVSMKIDVWYQTSPAFDGGRVEASVNGGASWFVIGGNNEPTHWYNAMMTDTSWTGSSNGWLTAQHPLNFLGGQSNVKIKIIYKTGMMSFQTAEGFAFDNIMIYECNSMPTSSFTLVQNANTVTVTNTSQDATGYLWNFGDQMALLPDTNTNTSYTYMTPGTYNITLSAYNECGVSTSSQTVTITVVDVEESNLGQIKLYPNPASNKLNIDMKGTQEKVQKIQVYNVLGIEVFNTDKNTNCISLEGFSAGVYYLKLTSDKNTYKKTFVVE